MNGASDLIEFRHNKNPPAGLLRVVSIWGWNSIEIIALAFEGLLAFLSLAFVGLITFGFLVLCANRNLAGKISRTPAASR